MRGLYPIVDVDTLARAGFEPLAFLGELLRATPPLVQLRAKSLSARETLELLRAFRARTRDAGCRLFANDRPDLAQLAGCDGVHLGQEDAPANEVQRCFPELAIGISTHNLSQLEQALGLGPEYVAFGPVYPTATKQNPDPTVGLPALREAHAVVQGQCPLVAIGGVTLSKARELAPVVELGAVISELLPQGGELSSVAERARELHLLLGGVG